MSGLASQWNNDVGVATLSPAPMFPELYQELWWYSGSYASANSAVGAVAGQNFVQKGSISAVTSTTGSATKLFTLNANWNPNLKYAFEATLWANGGTAYAQLWDITAGSVISGAQISNVSLGNPTVIRSGQFTLIPGHVYGVTIWNPSSGYVVDLTDASLIIFPPAGSVSPSLSSISLANPSGGTLKEAYYPLWVYSSGITTVSGGATSLGTYWIQKGSVSPSTAIGSAGKLYTLNNAWSANQKFALEASFYNGTAGDTAQVELWDATSNTAVSSSLISTTSNTATLVRSGSFTLTQGHVYGVTIGQTAGSCSLTKAHLVALGV